MLFNGVDFGKQKQPVVDPEVVVRTSDDLMMTLFHIEQLLLIIQTRNISLITSDAKS